MLPCCLVACLRGPPDSEVRAGDQPPDYKGPAVANLRIRKFIGTFYGSSIPPLNHSLAVPEAPLVMTGGGNSESVELPQVGIKLPLWFHRASPSLLFGQCRQLPEGKGGSCCFRMAILTSHFDSLHMISPWLHVFFCNVCCSHGFCDWATLISMIWIELQLVEPSF